MGVYRKSDGSTVSIPDDQASAGVASGALAPVSAADVGAPVESPESGGAIGTIGSFASGGLSGITLGASDYALKGLLSKGEFARLAADREAHPLAAGAGQIVGAIASGGAGAGATPAGYLARVTGGIAEGGGAAAKLVAGGIEGAVQNAGIYLSDTALGDRELSAEGIAGALGTGLEFGVGGVAAAHGIEAGTIAARRMFARVMDGGAAAAQKAAQDWAAHVASATEGFDQTADMARAKLAEAQGAHAQASLAQQRAGADLAEARVAAPAMDAARAPAVALDDNIAKIEAREAADKIAGPASMAEGGVGQPVRGIEDLQKLATSLDEYTAARRAFDEARAQVDPDLEAALHGLGEVDLGEGRRVPVGEFGAPGAGGVKSSDELARAAADAGADSGVEVAAPSSQAGSAEATRALKRPTSFPEGTPPPSRSLGEVAAGHAPGPIEPHAPPSPRPIASEDEFQKMKAAFRERLTPEEIQHSISYSREDYNDVNRYLRGDARVPKLGDKEAGIIKSLDSALAKSDLSEPITTYRAAHFDPGEPGASLKVGDVFADPAYMSTTYRNDNLSRFGNTEFVITSPAGTKIAPIPSSAAEGEFLLARNSKLRITSREELGSDRYGNERVRLHATVEPTGTAAAPASSATDSLAGSARPVVAHAEPLSDSEFSEFKKRYGFAADEHFSSEIHYSGKGSDLVNSELRSGEPLSPQAQKLNDGLMKAFELPESRLPRDATLYRGVSDNEMLGVSGVKERYANVKPGDVLDDPAFTSTAYSAAAKSRNEEVVFTIHAPAGTPALPIRSNYSSEGELLLPPGVKMRVDRVEYVPVSERWKDLPPHEVLPDKSVKIIEKNGDVTVKPPIRDIHATIISDHAPPSVGRPPTVGLDAPIEQLSVRQLNEYQAALSKEFDAVKQDSSEYNALIDKENAVIARRNSITEGKAPAPAHEYGATPAARPSATDSLTGLLRGTQEKLGAGASMNDIGAPGRAEYAAAKAERTAAASEHFRGKANAENYAGSDMAAAERSAQGEAVAQRAGVGGRGQKYAVQREHPMAVKQLEMAHDAALERAAAAVEPATKREAIAEAKAIEKQMTQVGARPGAVEDVAAIAETISRVEKAAANLTDAVGDTAPAAAKEHAAAFRAAEDAASRKTIARMARAADDSVSEAATPGSAGPDRRPSATPSGAQRIAAAKQAKLEADAVRARARANETEAAIGAKAAGQAASDARAALPPEPSSVSPDRGLGLGSKVLAGATAVEAAHDLGVPGIPDPHEIPIIGPMLSTYLKYRALRAAAGRFVGRVPATAEARAASLAAKTKDGIARAVDRSLGLVERNTPAIRTALTVGGALASDALAKRAFNDGHPDAGAKASTSEQAAVRIREVAYAATNPQAVVNMVRTQMRQIVDPDLIQAMEQHLLAMYKHLNDTAPQGPPPNPYSKKEWSPSPADAMQWGQRLAIAHNPQAAFDMLTAGTLTPAGADTFRAVYDKLFEVAQQRFIARAADLEHPVPYRQLLQNSLLFDVPLHASMDPQNAVVLATAHAGQPQPTGGGGGAPSPSIAGATNLSQLYQTTSERRSAQR